MVRINWTQKAKKDLKHISDFIAIDSKFFAIITIKEILKKVEILENFPKIGRTIPEINNTIFREIFYKNYRIMYKIVSDNQIDILAVVHGARNFDNKLLND
jgi:addiction module RelE/StbE family toxin